MSKKQRIIDGVDVSGCEYYNKDDKTCREVNGNYDTDICEFDKCENSNCYYKQLKAKEQELKKICKAFDIEYAIDEETGNLIGRCNKLYKKEQECEEKSREIGNLGYKIKNQRKEINIRLQQLDQLKVENDKLKQTLDEIEKTCLFKIENRQFVLPNVWQHFLNIVNKAKEA